MILTKKQLSFINDNWQLPDIEFIAAYNKLFKASLNFGQWRTYKSKHRLVKQRQEHWTPYQVNFLLSNYQAIGNVDIAEHFGWSSERKKGEKKVWKKMKQMGLIRSPESLERLKHDMGGRGWSAARANRIKSGKLPHHSEHAEGERWQRKKDKRWLIKVADKVVPLAIYLWEQQNGKVPTGYMVCFKDGDRQNCAIENLELRDRAKHAKSNSKISSNGLSFNYVAGIITTRRPELREIIKNQYPNLVACERQRLLNQRLIRNQNNER